MKLILLAMVLSSIGFSVANASPVSVRCSDSNESSLLQITGARELNFDESYLNIGATGTLSRAGSPTLQVTGGGVMLAVGTDRNVIESFGFSGRANPGNILVMVEGLETEYGFRAKRLAKFPLKVIVADQNDERLDLTCVVNY